MAFGFDTLAVACSVKHKPTLKHVLSAFSIPSTYEFFGTVGFAAIPDD